MAVALAYDLRFASEDLYLAVPTAKLGLICGPIETRLLLDLFGAAATKDLLFSGRSVAPGEALSFGLRNRCVPDASLDQEVQGQGREWAKLSCVSVRGTKNAIRAALAFGLEDVRGLSSKGRLWESTSARDPPPFQKNDRLDSRARGNA